MTSRHDHSATLLQYNGENDKEWEEVKDRWGQPICITGLTREKIAWLNTSCSHIYKWRQND